jgi:hypothetical protein
MMRRMFRRKNQHIYENSASPYIGIGLSPDIINRLFENYHSRSNSLRNFQPQLKVLGAMTRKKGGLFPISYLCCIIGHYACRGQICIYCTHKMLQLITRPPHKIFSINNNLI